MSDVAAMIRQTTPVFTAGSEHNKRYLNEHTALMLFFFSLSCSDGLFFYYSSIRQGIAK